MKNIYEYAYNIEHAYKIAAKCINEGYTVVGIEAEWGDDELSEKIDNVIGLAHHGKRSSNPAPCTRWDLWGKYKTDTCFIFSHFDNDAVLACLILEGRVPNNNSAKQFAEHVAWIDVHGAHTAHEDIANYNNWSKASIYLNTQINALKKSYADAGMIIHGSAVAVEKIFNDTYLDEFTECETLNENIYNSLDKIYSIKNKLHVYIGYRKQIDKYLVDHNGYVSNSIVNVHYDNNKQRVSIGVINEDIAKQYFGENGVIDILKKHFGDKSGGRCTVGGSPKNVKIGYGQFIKFVKDVKRILNG